MSKQFIPVVTIDGPSGVGKGTIASLLAQHLSFHLLDSGSIYRGLALASVYDDIDIRDEANMVRLAKTFDWQMHNQILGKTVYMLSGRDVSDDIRREDCAAKASIISSQRGVRQALVARQRSYHKEPGLVAEGRDMGTVIFPNARVKLFLTASVEIRANRRYKQLQAVGKSVSITEVMDLMLCRDRRDTTREDSPLKQASDAIVIDTGSLTVDKTKDLVISHVDNLLLS